MCKEEKQSDEINVPYAPARDRKNYLTRNQATGHLFYSHTNFLRIEDRGSHRLDTLVGGDVASSIHPAAIPDLTSLKRIELFAGYRAE